jgi:hypothetical protein
MKRPPQYFDYYLMLRKSDKIEHYLIFPKGIYVYRTPMPKYFQNPEGIVCKKAR